MSSVLWTAIISHYIRTSIQRSREGKTRPSLNKANWVLYIAIAWLIPISLSAILALARWIKQDPGSIFLIKLSHFQSRSYAIQLSLIT